MSRLSVTTLFDFDKVDHSKESEVHLDVVLTAPERENQKRIPLHMILAIDCSGSMAGGKLDSVKTTVSKLLDHLTENDTIGIIGFSDNAWEALPVLPMTASNRQQAKDTINKMHPMSMTNLSEAIQWSMERAVTAEKDKISRIVVLTDGLPTAGIQTHEGLVDVIKNMNPSLSLSTFGYGSDYNPELLLSMSNTGKGNHFYIQKDTDCSKAFALELGGLLSLFAQKIQVELTPSGVAEFKELLSDYEVKEEGGYRGLTNGKISFTIDDIYTGEKKHAVIKLGIHKASTAVCARKSSVCDVMVKYDDIETKAEVKIESKAKIQYTKADDVPKDPNEEVHKQLVLIQAAKMQLEAKNKADAGDLQGAQAVLQGGIQLFGTANSAFYSPQLSESFVTLSSAYSDRASYNTVGAKLGGTYYRALSKNRVSSSAASGEVYTYTSSLQESLLKSFESDSGSAPSITITGTKDEDSDEEEKKV